jgi:hypothetical protein
LIAKTNQYKTPCTGVEAGAADGVEAGAEVAGAEEVTMVAMDVVMVVMVVMVAMDAVMAMVAMDVDIGKTSGVE